MSTPEVRPVPEGYHTVTPYLILDNATAALDFYQRAFGATVKFSMEMQPGKIGHAELVIGDSPIMIADEHPELGALSAKTVGGSPVFIHLYVEDSDALFQQAVDAGGEVIRPLEDQFYGDRSGTIKDPFGIQWSISTHVEDVSPEELERRQQAMGKGGDS